MDPSQARVELERLKHSGIHPATTEPHAVRKIVFACDAGMGSSAMGASILRQKLARAGIEIAVLHSAVNEIPADADIVLTHRSLTNRARLKQPHAEHIALDEFLKSHVYDDLLTRFEGSNADRREAEIQSPGSSDPKA
jgi:PTS system mannitol-specific IIC component